MSKIGLIISGIPAFPRKANTGFDSDIVTISKVEEVTQIIKDVRDICRKGNPNFYSLEKTQNYTLYTIYNPNLDDHEARDAYIAITLFINKNETIVGNVTDKLNELMSLYVENEKNIGDNIFLNKISSYTTQSGQANALSGIQLGFKKYASLSEVNSIINAVQTKNFRKLYFFQKNLEIESNSKYIDYDNELKHKINIRGINANKHVIFLNNKQLRIEWSDTEISIPAFNNDKIIIQEGTEIIKEIDATGSLDFNIPAQNSRPVPVLPQIAWYKKYAVHMGIGVFIMAFAVVGIIKLSGNQEVEVAKVAKVDNPEGKTIVTKKSNNTKHNRNKVNDKRGEDLYNPEKGVYWDKYKQFYFIQDDKWYGMKFKLTNGDSIREEKILKNRAESIIGLNKHFNKNIKIEYANNDNSVDKVRKRNGPKESNDDSNSNQDPPPPPPTPSKNCDVLCENIPDIIITGDKSKMESHLKKIKNCNCPDEDELRDEIEEL